MINDRPVIGIMGSRHGDKDHTPFRYQNSVWAGGGFGVVLPFTTDDKTAAEYVQLCDGFMFSGGVDVDPKMYGEEIKFDSVEIDAERDAFEKLMFDKIYAAGIENCCISEMTIAELYYGAVKGRQEKNFSDVKQVERIFRIIPVYESFREFAEIRLELKNNGTPIDMMDLFIGSTARYNKYVLVSQNQKHMKHISGLQLEDWQ